VSHDQYIICTNNMVASNGTVGQTGNNFIISEQHLIMHCKFTNALYQTCLIANIWQLFLHSYGRLILNNNTDAQQVWLLTNIENKYIFTNLSKRQWTSNKYNFILNNTYIMNTINVIWTLNSSIIGNIAGRGLEAMLPETLYVTWKKCLILTPMH
jgi:frataxin-like iron-binding protein CyaY